MYEHPIKRAGLSLNRIIYSNTRMVYEGFPNLQKQQFNLSFKYRVYDAGKVTQQRCKSTYHILTLVFRLHQRRFRRGSPIKKEGMRPINLTLFEQMAWPPEYAHVVGPLLNNLFKTLHLHSSCNNIKH